MSSLLYQSARSGDLKLVKICIKAGIDVNEPDNNNKTPLRIAVSKGYNEIVKLLLDHNADVNIPDIYGQTPLWIAASKNMKNIMQLLISKSADINRPDNNDKTPLSVAVSKGYNEIVELLIDHEADINIPDIYGQTALDVAVKYDKAHIAKLIINKILSQNLSEEKPIFIENNRDLSGYWDKVHNEILSLKEIICFKISLFDFYSIKNQNNLASMSFNEEIKNIIISKNFTDNHPFFGKKIKEKFEKELDNNKIPSCPVEVSKSSQRFF